MNRMQKFCRRSSLFTSGNTFVYIEAECPKLDQQYLYVKNANHQIRTQPDCVEKLILDQVLGKSCNLTNVKLLKEAMEQLDDRNYILKFPHLTKVELNCGREDNSQLVGSYLVTLSVNCFLRTPEFTITNENDEVAGHPLKIMIVPNYTETITAALPHLTMNSIDLKKLHSLQDNVMLQTHIRPDRAMNDPLYHTTIPFYTLLLVTFAIITLIIAAKKFNLCKLKTLAEDSKFPEKYEVQSLPATFSHRV